jgi:zinc transport system substrate-binding protein
MPSKRSTAYANRSKPIPVFVSIPPQAYFVKRIGGDQVAVHILLPAGKNPATYAPAPAEISKLSKAKVYFRIGLPFETLLISRIANLSKQIKIVDTRTGINLRRMNSHDKHQKGGSDPHIWMNPVLVKIQAEIIYNTLAALDPEGRLGYAERLNSFLIDLDTLHTSISQALRPVKGKSIFVFHPTFGYFADAYGIRQVAVEIEGKAPKGKDLSLFIKKAKKEKTQVIFVQPGFDSAAALKIAAAINGVVVQIDPLAENYIDNLKDIADKVYKGLSESHK